MFTFPVSVIAFYPLRKRLDWLWGPQGLTVGTMVSFPGNNEALFPISTALKNEWRYKYIPPIRLQGVHRDKFNFLPTSQNTPVLDNIH